MIKKIHLEPTSRCTLGCPRCERTVLLQKFKKKTFDLVDIDPKILDNFVDVPVEHFGLCGNLGDPIYHPNLYELIYMIKNKGSSVHINTNASYRNKKWWKDILSLLDHNDHINFSVDGTPENFDQYRVNGDWDTIKDAMDLAAASEVKTFWKYIVFSFNEETIDEAQQLAKQIGIDDFKISQSDRWEVDDYLKPSNDTYVGDRDFVQNEIYKKDKTLLSNVEIDPECANNEMHYISAKGLYAPCCYSAHHHWYYKSPWWKNRNIYDIRKTKMSNCLEQFNEFYNNIQKEQPNYCIFNCGKC